MQTSWQSYKNTYIDFQKWRHQQQTLPMEDEVAVQDVPSYSPVIKNTPALKANTITTQNNNSRLLPAGLGRNIPQKMASLPKSNRLPSHMIVASSEEAAKMDDWLNTIPADMVNEDFFGQYNDDDDDDEKQTSNHNRKPRSPLIVARNLTRDDRDSSSSENTSDYNFDGAATKMTEEITEEATTNQTCERGLRRTTMALSNLKLSGTGEEDTISHPIDSNGKSSSRSPKSQFRYLTQRVKDTIRKNKAFIGKKLIADSFLSALNFKKKDDNNNSNANSLKRRSRSDDGLNVRVAADLNQKETKKHWWKI